jgi:hypothetical protein
MKDEVFIEDSMTLVLTLNGKKRDQVEVLKNISKESVIKTEFCGSFSDISTSTYILSPNISFV